MTDKCTSPEGHEKKWSEIVKEERDRGNVVCILLPGEVGTIPVKEIVKQPAEGLLWDLNRDEVTALSFMDQEGMIHWVNNFAVALVIRELKSQVAQLEEENKTLKGNDDRTEKCMNCSSMVEQIWHVSDELWNELSGYAEGSGILCSRCFDRKAREKGIYLYWACQPDSYPEVADAEEQMMSEKPIERPKILNHDAGYFDGEQYIFSADEIKECIDWADSIEEEITALKDALHQDGKSLADGSTSKEIRKPTYGNADPVLVSHAFLNTMADKVVQLEEALHQDEHIIIFTEDGWSIQHLVECRPDMTKCEIHKRAQIELGDGACGLKGKYKVLIVDGELDFEKIPE